MYAGLDAEDLAEKWGCNEYNPCWPQCVEVAQTALDREKEGTNDAKVVVHNIWTSRNNGDR